MSRGPIDSHRDQQEQGHPHGNQVTGMRPTDRTLMLKFAWRWVKVGDKVLLHDRHHLERELISGVVGFVDRVDGQTRPRVRTIEDGKTVWVSPTPLFVHPDPLDPGETCWICDENDTPSKERVPTKETATA